MRATLALLVLALGCALAANAAAHPLRIQTLWLDEIAPGRFAVTASPRELLGSLGFPAHCAYRAGELACGTRGLSGDVSLLEPTRESWLSLSVSWSNAEATVHTLSQRSPSVRLRGQSVAASVGERFALVGEYVGLGTARFASQLDHVLFVLGLGLLVRRASRLMTTLAAFTLTHSMALWSSALGGFEWPERPTAVCVALSSLLLACVLARREASLSERMPWLVALGCGPLHGFGFARELREVSLAPHWRGLSVLGFNLGVEVGQLAAVGVLGAFLWLLRRALPENAPDQRQAARTLAYALGVCAAYAAWARIFTLVNGS
ncbi:MAG: HupE/UreJ family protein [Polyangiaceae bacterium]